MARWAECTVETNEEGAEAVAALLIDHGTGGVVLDEQGAALFVRGYWPDDERLPARLRALEEGLKALPAAGLAAGSLRLHVRWVEEEDWAHAWKAYFRPLPVGRRLLVRPSWEPVPPEAVSEGRLPIVLDPGMAFGTGSHPTTRLCLELLEEHLDAGTPCADVGTGSGILAIAAALLGASIVAAVDIDPLAAEIARSNVDRNGLADRIRVSAGSADEAAHLLAEWGGRAGLVVANITAEVLVGLRDSLLELTAEEGLLVLSGIVDGKAERVRSAFSATGLKLITERREGEWVAFAWRRSSRAA